MVKEGGARRQNRNTAGKWLNSPIKIYEGSPQEVRTVIPDFERRGLVITQPGKLFPGNNPHLDLIVRKPIRNQNGKLWASDTHKDDHIPIGTVSKEYRLVPHKEVFDTALLALAENDIDPSHTKVELLITEYGERMHFSIYLLRSMTSIPGTDTPWRCALNASTPWKEAHASRSLWAGSALSA